MISCSKKSATQLEEKVPTRDTDLCIDPSQRDIDTAIGPYARQSYIPASTANRTMSAALGTSSRFIKIDRCILIVRSLRPSS